jgi:acyl-CoA synthetase (AMP-forming)/AMP-acid ligase II
MTKSRVGDSLWAAWRRTARRRGDRTAAIDAVTGEALGFADLHAVAEALGEEILAKARGTTAAFCLPNGFAWLSVFLGLQAAGAAALPLDPSTPEAARAALARSLGASFLWDGKKLRRIASRKRITRGAAVVKTTSGSTGLPQPVPCRAAHLLADGRHIIKGMGIRPEDTNLGLIPFGHSYGLGNLILPLILQGTPIVFAGDYLPTQIPEWIARHKATVFPSVPAIFRLLALLPGTKTLRPLRTAISAGAPLPPETAAAFHQRYGLRLRNFYGSSETGGIAYDRAGTGAMKALPGVRITLGKEGRVLVKSPAVAMPRGRHLLPDLGALSPSGVLRLEGRARPLANIGGKKVAPLEIESLLRSLPSVSDAWVAVLQEKGRDYLAAAVEASVPASVIEAALHQNLPAWKIPRRITVKKRLPRTARGKLDTVALTRLFEFKIQN